MDFISLYLYHKQHVKKHIADLHALAQQRQDILKQLNYVSWFDYINQQSQVEPLQLVVLSQLWPDPELLADLSDLCRYGGQFGILPVLVVSEHFFPAIADDWYAQFLEECCLKALVVELKQGYYVQIKHHQLQEIADLYKVIDLMMALPEALQFSFEEKLTQYQEERKMPLLTLLKVTSGLKVFSVCAGIWTSTHWLNSSVLAVLSSKPPSATQFWQVLQRLRV